MTTDALDKETSEPAGIYVHVPFCAQKCRYCDFYSVNDIGLQRPFVAALEKEVAMVAENLGPCDTVYFGGGTPTVIGPAAFSGIFDNLARHISILSDAEVTLEANPGTITPAQLKTYRHNGINRINIGVQSFREDNLRFLGRIHTAREAELALKWARQAGFENIGLDLIYGLPGQKISDWQEDLESAVARAPEHISCYTLTLEPGTPLERDYRHGKFQVAKEDQVARMVKTTVSFLAENGYRQYEVSSFARSEMVRSRHNLKYWHFVPYVGFGPAAHSYLPPIRRWNKADVAAYMDDLDAGDLPIDETETLTRERAMIEAIYLGLRLNDGIDLPDFEERFGLSFAKVFGAVTGDLQADNLIYVDNRRCALTPDGLVLMDSIASRLIDCINI